MSARQSMHGPSSWHAMGRRGRSIPTGRWLRWRLSLRPCVRTRWLLRLGPGLARVFELEATPQLAIAVSVLPALRSSYVQTEPTPVLTCGFLPVLPSCPKSEYTPMRACARRRVRARMGVYPPKTVKTVRQECEMGASTSRNVRLTTDLPSPALGEPARRRLVLSYESLHLFTVDGLAAGPVGPSLMRRCPCVLPAGCHVACNEHMYCSIDAYASRRASLWGRAVRLPGAGQLRTQPNGPRAWTTRPVADSPNYMRGGWRCAYPSVPVGFPSALAFPGITLRAGLLTGAASIEAVDFFPPSCAAPMAAAVCCAMLRLASESSEA